MPLPNNQEKRCFMALSHPAPQHIAIIMDGNGRWAKKRGLPRNAGHKAGAETFRRIAKHCNTLGTLLESAMVRYLFLSRNKTETA